MLELDRLIPVGARPDASALPFELKDAEIEAYWKSTSTTPRTGVRALSEWSPISVSCHPP